MASACTFTISPCSNARVTSFIVRVDINTSPLLLPAPEGGQPLGASGRGLSYTNTPEGLLTIVAARNNALQTGHPQGIPLHYFLDLCLRTASASSLPGKKRTRSFAGTWIGLRSRGLTPLRAALVRTLKEPKPTKRTSSPPLRVSRIVSSVASNASAACF